MYLLAKWLSQLPTTPECNYPKEPTIGGSRHLDCLRIFFRGRSESANRSNHELDRLWRRFSALLGDVVLLTLGQAGERNGGDEHS